MTAPTAYAGAIKLVLFDVDGVLTDGTLYIASNGEAMKTFSVRDGVAIALLRAHGLQCGIISGKSSPALDFRIQQLKFDVVATGRNDKLAALAEVLVQVGLNEEETAFVGDDVVDLPLLPRVGAFYAPSDAHPLVLDAAHHVVRAIGGHGVAREVAEHVLLSGGLDLAAAYAPLCSSWADVSDIQ